MESTTHKQLAQSATQKQNAANLKIGAISRELEGVSDEDSTKKAGLKNKILSLQNQSQGHAQAAGEHRGEAIRAEIKENDAKFKEAEAEQKTLQKEETKQQKKLEEKLEEKAAKKSEKASESGDLNKDFGDELLFLNDERDFSPVATEDVIDFTIANPVKQETQSAADPAKASEDEKLIKSVGASATGT